MLNLIAYSIANKFPNVKNISTEQLDSKLDKLQGTSLIIIDAREKEEYLVSRIPSAKYLHFKTEPEEIEHFLSENSEAGKFTQVVCYCSLGYRSSVLAEKINRLHLESVEALNLEGSIFKWANENRSLEGSQSVHPFSYLWGFLGLNLTKWKWNAET